MDQLKLEMEPGAKAEVWIVEFRHAWFGWLDLDTKYPSREAAESARDLHLQRCDAYPCRARRIG